MLSLSRLFASVVRWVIPCALVIFALELPLSGASSTSTRPNIILLLTDDQGYGDLACHGNPVLKTPHLDRLHAESIRFTDFHSAPMCTPTRGELMTGVDALRNGAMNVSSGRTNLRRDYPTMAEIFAARGWRTGLFGKWHLGDNYPYRPQDRGFEESIWFPSSHITSAPDFFKNDYFDDVYMHNGAQRPFKGFCTDVFFREAMAWMRACAGRNEPFLCYLPTNAPHAPRWVPDRYREPYRTQKADVASFFAMIANIDENVGRLEAFLRATGLRDNTVLIFMTDNGTAAGETVFTAGMRGKKAALYEGGHRVPFFVRWPAGKLRPAADIATLAQAQDVLPTLLELCQVPKPESAKFDGMSLAGLLRGESDALPDRMLVSQFSRIGASIPKKGDAVVLWKRWRLVANQELYDLDTDPAQKDNVLDRFPDVATRMAEHYSRWWESLEARVNEWSPIHIGSQKENPSLLSPCDWRDSYFDRNLQVRTSKRNGAWMLFVEQDGDYEFSLRRWPVEADAPIVAGMPVFQGEDGDPSPPGVALPIASAELKIGDRLLSKPVASTDKAASFELALKRGATELKTWFRDADGREICGAYFVYVRNFGETFIRPETLSR
jgi:arylsulfatase A-like enzyme